MKKEYEKVLLPNSVQQELEKLRAQAVADAAEIARLQSGFEELKQWAKEESESCLNGDYTDYKRGMYVMTGLFIENINRITGVEK